MLKEVDDTVKRLFESEKDSLITEGESSFLLVFQTKQQREWLEQFGNTITCMDATYKTLRYGFPLFFLLVKTALGVGRVVATIIP